MKYLIFQQAVSGQLFLSEADGVDLDEERKEGNILLGDMEFSGRALVADGIIKMLEKNGLDGGVFSAYADQVATATYKAVVEIFQKELNL